ncbi:hypothetical protein BDY17DRAFT_165640 [Neohortaea acidophila]|uniref:F-box domain-containing protein n=1 Tax=Neohortaea acidophila TaxID=245834 RepID=A0A6A6PRL6_9PEZI|nr:uncharacterized protein BDY17DRAFT_165640 [Neohortaea acidophila]KAF2482750.1 hypothetical protein BDY17DRAFT_165640 [Neohortaea acidophila]
MAPNQLRMTIRTPSTLTADECDPSPPPVEMIHNLPLRPLRQQRPTPTPPSAVQRVLNIPELLEIILLYLSQKDLLLSQRTSRAFRRTIQASPRLQKSLFLLPDWRLEGRAFNAYAKDQPNRPGRKPENNRLLLRAFPTSYPTVTLVIVNDGDGVDSTTTNPRDRRPSEHWSWDVCISFPADRAPNTSPAVLYPEASWRRMFLSQPPCTSLHLVRRWQRSLSPAIVREDGIKMGEFVDEATKTNCDWHQSYISSDRDWHFEGNIRCSSVTGEEGEV